MCAQKVPGSCQGEEEAGEAQVETTGAASHRLLSQQEEPAFEAPEYQREMHKTFEENITEAVRRGLKLGRDVFYIVVLFRKDRLMSNVVRQQFFPRITCPTPDYDQTVYRYSKATGDLEYLWTVPDQASTQLLLFQGGDLPEEYKQLSQFCQEYILGNLERKAAALNGELE